MIGSRALPELGGPAALVVAAALVGSTASRSTEIYFISALVSVSMVVALYVFVGNSGVLGSALPTNQSQYLTSFVFGVVILVLLVRPGGLFTRGVQTVERV